MEINFLKIEILFFEGFKKFLVDEGIENGKGVRKADPMKEVSTVLQWVCALFPVSFRDVLQWSGQCKFSLWTRLWLNENSES